MTQKRVYLDYAASTPVDQAVELAMRPYFGKVYGNPHALHGFGQEASRAVFGARRKIAAALGADYREIIFTGSATEANNLALRGVVKSYKLKVKSSEKPRIITTTIEHESVLETCRDLEKDGVEVVYVPVGNDGIVDSWKIKTALNERTILVSIMHANNEVGTVQPIAEIASAISEYRSNKTNKSDRSYPFFHTDAVQSFQYLDCHPETLGVDLLTLSAHKIYGPKGIGAMYVRKGVKLLPIITGSGQESGLRSGTDNVPYIVGFAKAVEIAEKMQAKEMKRVSALRDYFWRQLKKAVPKLQANGSLKNRLPNNINIYFPGEKAHNLQIKLDLAGIAVSPGAACRSAVAKASYVIAEMGFPIERAVGSLRFSLGRQTIKSDVDWAIKRILKIVA